MNFFILFGKLLNYPICCTEHFMFGGGWATNGDVHYNGFIPCIEHAKLTRDQLVELVGRDFKNEPEEFEEFAREAYGKSLKRQFTIGKKVYKAAGKLDFFLEAWKFAESYKREESEDFSKQYEARNKERAGLGLEPAR